MPLFGRRKQVVPDGPPDETFPFFTAEQADRFRDLARQGFAQAGLEVTVHPDHVVDADGRMFGLGNLAATCHNAERGEREWRALTADHATRIVRGMDAPSAFQTMTRAELMASTYVRLMPTADLAFIRAGYGTELVDGISEVLNVDLPETVQTYLDEHVQTHGPLDDLRRAGLANLRTVRFDERQTLGASGGGSFEVLMGDSMFTASKLVVLGEVLDELGLPVDHDHGVLVAAPFRHQLAIHAIRDASVIPSLNGLVTFAGLGYDGGAGALSPEVFWWRGGQLQRISVRGPDGTEVRVGPDLTDVLNRVC